MAAAVCRGLLCLAVWLALILAAVSRPVLAQAPTAATRNNVEIELDKIRAQLEAIGRALTRESLTDGDLATLMRDIDPIRVRIEAVAAQEQPKVDALVAQLEKLGKKPDDKSPPESPEAARQRADLEKARERADGLLRVAESLAVRARLLATNAADRRRAMFTGALFNRSFSILSPLFWADVVRKLPLETQAILRSFVDWGALVAERFGGGHALPITLGLGLLLVLFGPLFRILRRFDPRSRERGEPTRFRLAVMAAIVVIVYGGSALLVGFFTLSLLESAGVAPLRLLPVAQAAVHGAAAVAFTAALAEATLAPSDAAWRLIAAGDSRAHSYARAMVQGAVVLAIGRFSDAILQAVTADLQVSIAARGIIATAFALIVAWHMRRLAQRDRDEAESLGPPAGGSGAVMGPVRVLANLSALAVLGAVVAGFIALSTFMAEQTLTIVTVGLLLLIAIRLVDDAVLASLASEGRLGRQLMVAFGLRSRQLDQFSVIASGLARLGMVLGALMLVLAPWGIESRDLLSSLRAVIFGIRVGDVTLSLSTLLLAFFVFMLGVVLTRIVQRWLEDKFLPSTDLDAGLRNSIRTAVGYFGIISAAAVAVAAIGFSLEKLAIVAGALSVGIGFGLQSIANNFVSGLILLWERPIKVGDWIMVGDEQGYVRRINVRATEIETFDRTTVIVPNSTLITGMVKNKVHSDRSGRVQLQISVPRDADAVLIRTILETVARAHPDVIKEPPPRALFKKIGDQTLEFEINGFIPDVEIGARVSSELHFALLEALAEHGLNAPIALTRAAAGLSAR